MHIHVFYTYLIFLSRKCSKNAPFLHTNWVLSFFPFKFPGWDFYQYPCLLLFEYLTEWVWVSFLVLSIFWNYFGNFPFGHLFSFWVYPLLIKLCGPFSYLAYKFFIINILFFFLSFNFVLFIMLLFLFFWFSTLFKNFLKFLFDQNFLCEFWVVSLHGITESSSLLQCSYQFIFLPFRIFNLFGVFLV